MKVWVTFGPAIRQYVGNNPALEVEATSVNELFDQLDKLYPGFRRSLTDENGNLYSYIEIRPVPRPSNYDHRKLTLGDKIPEGHTSLNIAMKNMSGG